ncbi:MAG: hypothetical protein NVSMB25_23700 [Thermoleophilaceae bacterium]
MTRGAFILGSALTAGALSGLAAVGPLVSEALAGPPGGGDRAIIEFALTLEQLEANFYARAYREVPGLSGEVKQLTKDIGSNEAQHVQILTDLLNQLAANLPAPPRFDFGDAFSSQSRYLEVAQTLEDTGVSAYNGAGPLLQDKQILASAGAIVQIEARHASAIRALRGQPIAPSAFDTASTIEQVHSAVQPFIRRG